MPKVQYLTQTAWRPKLCYTYVRGNYKGAREKILAFNYKNKKAIWSSFPADHAGIRPRSAGRRRTHALCIKTTARLFHQSSRRARCRGGAADSCQPVAAGFSGTIVRELSKLSLCPLFKALGAENESLSALLVDDSQTSSRGLHASSTLRFAASINDAMLPDCTDAVVNINIRVVSRVNLFSAACSGQTRKLFQRSGLASVNVVGTV